MIFIGVFLLWTHISPVWDWFADLSHPWVRLCCRLLVGGALMPRAVLTRAPWEVRDVLVQENCLVIQQISQTSQPRATDDGNPGLLGNTGTQPFCCFLIHLVAVSAGGEQVSEIISPFKERASKDKSPVKVQRKRNFIKTIITEASLLLLKMYHF